MGKKLLDPIFYFVAKSSSHEAFLSIILTTVLLMSFVTQGLILNPSRALPIIHTTSAASTHSINYCTMNSSQTVRTGIGLSNTLGAFLAGLLLAETKYRYQIEADIAPFRGLLLGFFFITVGFNIDLGMPWPTPHSSFSPLVFVAHKRAFTLPPSLTSYDVEPCT